MKWMALRLNIMQQKKGHLKIPKRKLSSEKKVVKKKMGGVKKNGDTGNTEFLYSREWGMGVWG